MTRFPANSTPGDNSLESLCAPAQSQIAQINSEIGHLKSSVQQIRQQRSPIERSIHTVTVYLKYLQLAFWLRSSSTLFELFRIALSVIVPLSFGATTFLVTVFAIDSLAVDLFLSVLTAFCSFVVYLALLYQPSDDLLPSRIADTQDRISQAKQQLEHLVRTDGLTNVQAELRSKLGKLREQQKVLRQTRRDYKQRLREDIRSGKRRRLILLDRDWRAMRGYDWEEYLVEVFTALGTKVERTGQCGDQGCDLIVEIGRMRIAVQAKGFDELSSVNHKAVQEAYAGMAFRSCTACAVITNTIFRKSAHELAAMTGCVLIGRDEFPDFVLGKIDLCKHK